MVEAEQREMDKESMFYDSKESKLLELSREVAEYLQKNFHPNTTVIIEVNSIRVEENVMQMPIEYAPD